MTNGMILHMGNFQNEVTHEIPIQKKNTESRLSFTFRHHILLNSTPNRFIFIHKS